MALTVSVVVLLGLLLLLMLRSRTLTGGAAFIAVMFGFFLASTGAAEPINTLANAVLEAIPDL